MGTAKENEHSSLRERAGHACRLPHAGGTCHSEEDHRRPDGPWRREQLRLRLWVGMGKGKGKGGGKSKHKHKAKGVEDCVDESQLRFVSGWCCGFTGLMLEDCLGCSGESQFCCLTERCCCKAGQPALGCEAPKGEICQLGRGIISCGCKNCMGSSDKAGCSCIQSQTQLCCIVQNCAIPTTNEIPCLCGCCGLSCYPEVGCCEKIKKIDGGSTKAAQKGHV